MAHSFERMQDFTTELDGLIAAAELGREEFMEETERRQKALIEDAERSQKALREARQANWQRTMAAVNKIREMGFVSLPCGGTLRKEQITADVCRAFLFKYIEDVAQHRLCVCRLGCLLVTNVNQFAVAASSRMMYCVKSIASLIEEMASGSIEPQFNGDKESKNIAVLDNCLKFFQMFGDDLKKLDVEAGELLSLLDFDLRGVFEVLEDCDVSSVDDLHRNFLDGLEKLIMAEGSEYEDLVSTLHESSLQAFFGEFGRSIIGEIRPQVACVSWVADLNHQEMLARLTKWREGVTAAVRLGQRFQEAMGMRFLGKSEDSWMKIFEAAYAAPSKLCDLAEFAKLVEDHGREITKSASALKQFTQLRTDATQLFAALETDALKDLGLAQTELGRLGAVIRRSIERLPGSARSSQALWAFATTRGEGETDSENDARTLSCLGGVGSRLFLDPGSATRAWFVDGSSVAIPVFDQATALPAAAGNDLDFLIKESEWPETKAPRTGCLCNHLSPVQDRIACAGSYPAWGKIGELAGSFTIFGLFLCGATRVLDEHLAPLFAGVKDVILFITSTLNGENTIVSRAVIEERGGHFVVSRAGSLPVLGLARTACSSPGLPMDRAVVSLGYAGFGSCRLANGSLEYPAVCSLFCPPDDITEWSLFTRSETVKLPTVVDFIRRDGAPVTQADAAAALAELRRKHRGAVKGREAEGVRQARELGAFQLLRGLEPKLGLAPTLVTKIYNEYVVGSKRLWIDAKKREQIALALERSGLHGLALEHAVIGLLGEGVDCDALCRAIRAFADSESQLIG